MRELLSWSIFESDDKTLPREFLHYHWRRSHWARVGTCPPLFVSGGHRGAHDIFPQSQHIYTDTVNNRRRLYLYFDCLFECLTEFMNRLMDWRDADTIFQDPHISEFDVYSCIYSMVLVFSLHSVYLRVDHSISNKGVSNSSGLQYVIR